MRAFITTMIVLLIAAPSFANPARVPTNKCTGSITVEASHDAFYDIGFSSNAEAAPISIFYDRDVVGSEATGSINLQACMLKDGNGDVVANSCFDLDWDSDGDGTVDTNILTGATAATGGLTGISGFPYLRVQEETAGTNDAYVICRSF